MRLFLSSSSRVFFAGLLAVSVLLAGCADPTDEPSVGQSAPQAESLPLQSSGWYNSTSTHLQSPGLTFGVDGHNCVFFTSGVQRIVAGWVEVAWASPVPTLDEMALFVGPNHQGAIAGTSPLRLELQDVQADEQVGVWFYLRSADLAVPSLDAQVDMQMQWSFVYEGSLDPVVAYGGCG